MALVGGQAPLSRAMTMKGKVTTIRMAAMTAVAAPPVGDRVTAVKAEVGGEGAAGETAAILQAADPRAADPQAADPQAVDPQAADLQAAIPPAADPQGEILAAVVEAAAGVAEGVTERVGAD